MQVFDDSEVELTFENENYKIALSSTAGME